ncbi:MAG: CoA transferase [Deltaproteobacteria bacterium]|nr:CoA transferase [Deltaproteobacteria bacterium]
MERRTLQGIRVLDVTLVYAGPFCGLLLADLGAEVIKIERPGGEVGRFLPPLHKVEIGGPQRENRSGYFMSFNRNKLGLTLNLKHPKGIQIFKELVKISDVVLENYAPGVMKNLGIDYRVLKDVNPKIIMASISGFGQKGPNSQKVSFDIVAQAMGGLMSLTGYPQGPPTKTGTSLGDCVASLYAALGIVASLYHREATGRGQYIDVSQQESIASILEAAVVRYTMEGKVLTRIGSNNPNASPYGCFQCKDGYFIVGVVGEEQWERFCQALGVEEWRQDPRYRTNVDRLDHVFEIQKEIESWAKDYTVEEIIQKLERHRIPCSRIQDITELVHDPHLKERRFFVEVEHPIIGKVILPGFPYKFSETPQAEPKPSPGLGEHNGFILTRYLGKSAEELKSLYAEGVL